MDDRARRDVRDVTAAIDNLADVTTVAHAAAANQLESIIDAGVSEVVAELSRLATAVEALTELIREAQVPATPAAARRPSASRRGWRW